MMARILSLAGVLWFAGWATCLADGVVQFEHRGIKIVGKPAPQDGGYDIEITSPEAGAELIRRALDILYEGSPLNGEAIEKLKAAGNVFIVYDPAFPGRELMQVTIAAFLPDFYQAEGDHKDFYTVVGRFGGKWQARDLAPVLAHELTGHGMQHLRGRLEHVRTVDLECEAYLYQEGAYQDLGFDKSARDIIKFRQALERHWCNDFRRWQRKNQTPNLHAWERKNPDVPALLRDYLSYIEALRKDGTADAAIALANAERRHRAQQMIATLGKSKDPEDHFQLAMRLHRGIGTDADPAAAVEWFKRAAEKDHAGAQYQLAKAYWRGEGTAVDKKQAARWAEKAARNDSPHGAYLFGAMLFNGDGIPRDRSAGIEWLKKAQRAGSDAATRALRRIENK